MEVDHPPGFLEEQRVLQRAIFHVHVRVVSHPVPPQFPRSSVSLWPSEADGEDSSSRSPSARRSRRSQACTSFTEIATRSPSQKRGREREREIAGYKSSAGSLILVIQFLAERPLCSSRSNRTANLETRCESAFFLSSRVCSFPHDTTQRSGHPWDLLSSCMSSKAAPSPNA